MHRQQLLTPMVAQKSADILSPTSTSTLCNKRSGMCKVSQTRYRHGIALPDNQCVHVAFMKVDTECKYECISPLRHRTSNLVVLSCQNEGKTRVGKTLKTL